MGCAELTGYTNAVPFVLLRGGEEFALNKWKSGGPLVSVRQNTSLQIRPEDFIRLELSFINEVEKVFVARENDGRVLRVLTIINERNPAVKERIYPIELSIMDEFPSLRFDFHVLSRMNRNLNDVIAPKGTLVFSR